MSTTVGVATRLPGVGVRQLGSRAKHQLESRRREREEARTYREFSQRSFATGADLLAAHFATWSQPDHVNLPGFAQTIELMGDRPQIIVETGTSAWGTDSTRLWDAYIARFGGELWSVDLSPSPSKRLADQVSDRTHLVVDDSVHFLTDFAQRREGTVVGVCYLDSWDLDWSDPDPAAAHGLAEWHAVRPLMGPGSVLVIDDSPGSLDWVPEGHRQEAEAYLASHGYLPGKGALAHQELVADPRVSLKWHGYNSVYLFDS